MSTPITSLLGSGFGSSRRQDRERDKPATREELFFYLDKLYSHLDSSDNNSSSNSSSNSDDGDEQSGSDQHKPFTKKDLVSLRTMYTRVCISHFFQNYVLCGR